MEGYIQGANRLNQKTLITRNDRFYFVVTPFRQLDEDDREEVRKILSNLQKRKLQKKAQLATMKIIREIEKKKRELHRLPVSHSSKPSKDEDSER